MNGYFIIDGNVKICADKKMNNDSVKRLLKSFCLKNEDFKIAEGKELTFCIGKADIPKLSAEKEFAICVTETGAAVVGKDYGGLMRGFFSLLMKIEQEKDVLKIKTVTEESNYNIKNRMIHICVFPENDLYYVKKLIRLCALCQYTHIVIEFWGMLKFESLKELSWPQAFTKDEAKELIKECGELGIEPIPMFNQLGHASGSRGCYGKHVVLEQNPNLQHLFTPDGWAWDINSGEVVSLLKEIRKELYELFGKGEYIHLGCDEAHYITHNKDLRKNLAKYLADLTNEVEREGRCPMIWMDMLLEKDTFKNCYATGEKEEVGHIRNSTAKSTVFVDWQYDCIEAPIPSLASLKDCGRKVMGAPWFNKNNYNVHIKTIEENEMFGIMLTTWHTLNRFMSSILGCAKNCGAKTFYWSDFSGLNEETATILRKVSFEGNNYAQSGWSKAQIDI